MLHSMTGYGVGTATEGELSVRVEMRSVNHRFLDINMRLPHHWLRLETQLRQLVERNISRGRLEIYVTLEDFRVRERTVILDEPLLRGYIGALRRAEEIAGPISADFACLLSVPGLFSVADEPEQDELMATVLHKAATEALEALLAMRAAEGRRLEADITGRIDKIGLWLEGIRRRQPEVIEEYRERLQKRIQELLPALEIDEHRLAMEVALAADRSCITEECVRIESHIQQFRNICLEGGPVGRKLDFLLQEIHREISTMGVKSGDQIINTVVVDMKAELEKVREQVQNIE
ncbi:MAG TPA: YicC family protein [Firmicutes bacterium]|nr:YicC family protein [Bacillota bacterium]